MSPWDAPADPGRAPAKMSDAEFRAQLERVLAGSATTAFEARAMPETAVRPASVTDAVLESRSGTAQWSTDANGLYLPKSLLTTKGDIVTRTNAAAVRKAVGADGLALFADSTAADGLAYKTVYCPTWTTLESARTHDGGAGGDQFFTGAGAVANGGNVYATDVPSFWFDPAEFLVTGRVLQARILVSLIPNGTAQAVNKQFWVGQVAATGGAGAVANVALVGGVIVNTGYSLAPNGGPTKKESTPINISGAAAGGYLFGFTNSGAAAAGSAMVMGAQFQIRHV